MKSFLFLTFGCLVLAQSFGASLPRNDVDEEYRNFLLKQLENIENEGQDERSEAVQPRTCGVVRVSKNQDIEGKIVNGSYADPHQFPWQVNVAGRRLSQFCGGSIIDERHILTAGHCVNDRNHTNLRFVVGDHNRKIDEGTETIHVMKTITIHPEYHGIRNDIAIITTQDPIVFDENVQPVCMPTGQLVGGEEIIVSGWGNTLQTSDSRILNYAVMPIVDYTECKDKMKSVMEHQEICAGFKEGMVDSCSGDSGGPLVYLRDDHYELHGIVSYGSVSGCAYPERYGVYTNVPHYLPWVQEYLANEQL